MDRRSISMFLDEEGIGTGQTCLACPVSIRSCQTLFCMYLQRNDKETEKETEGDQTVKTPQVPPLPLSLKSLRMMTQMMAT